MGVNDPYDPQDEQVGQWHVTSMTSVNVPVATNPKRPLCPTKPARDFRCDKVSLKSIGWGAAKHLMIELCKINLNIQLFKGEVRSVEYL